MDEDTVAYEGTVFIINPHAYVHFRCKADGPYINQACLRLMHGTNSKKSIASVIARDAHVVCIMKSHRFDESEFRVGGVYVIKPSPAVLDTT